jgi:hypothetical protein
VCTLLIGIDVLGPGTAVLGANRDESPERATQGPGILVASPRVIGGRDLVAGGTWLAIRDARFVTALMNRRPHPGDPTDGLRSRGLLCLEAASTARLDRPARIDPGTGEPRPDAWDMALRSLGDGAYGRCTLVGIDPDLGSWAVVGGGGEKPRGVPIPAGWHVITHAELDDPVEPRTHHVLSKLEGVKPRSVDEALARFASILRSHGDDGGPPVCIHREHFPTVSSTLLALGAVDRPRYLHADGPPCVTEYRDHSALLGADAPHEAREPA